MVSVMDLGFMVLEFRFLEFRILQTAVLINVSIFSSYLIFYFYCVI